MGASYDTAKRCPDTNHAFFSQLLGHDQADSESSICVAKGGGTVYLRRKNVVAECIATFVDGGHWRTGSAAKLGKMRSRCSQSERPGKEPATGIRRRCNRHEASWEDLLFKKSGD